jgi:hypothetical protein
MANGDETTATQDVNTMGLTGDTGVVGIDLPVDPNTVTPPTRVVNMNDPKTLEFIKQENLQFARPNATGILAAIPTTFKMQRSPSGSQWVSQWVYVGENLVDEKNVISQRKYEISTKGVYEEFFRLKNDAERTQLFQTMQRLGYYGNQKPSPQALRGLGLTSADAGALQDFMWLSNSKGRTMKALVNLIATGGIKVPDGLAGGGRTVSVVSREDAAKQTGTAFFELLGRAATPAEVKVAVQAIQDMDRQRQLSNVENPSTLDVAAEQQAKKAAPGEFGAYSAGKAINQIFSLLGGA